MRWGVRTRELLVITMLTLIVVSMMSLAHLVRLSHLGVQEAVGRAQTELREIAVVAEAALSRDPTRPETAALAEDPAIRSLLAAVVAHSPDVVYARIEGPDGTPIAEGIPRSEALSDAAPLAGLLDDGPFARLWTLFREGQVREMDLPLELDGEAFARVRLGTDTSLLRADVQRALVGSAGVGLLALVLSWGVAIVVTGLTRQPLRRLSRQIERIRAGDDDLDEDAWDMDFAALAAQLRSLGNDIRSERLALLAEKRTLQEVLDHLQDGILLVDEDDAVLFYNRALATLLGAPLHEALGSELDELLPATHPLVRVVQRVREEDPQQLEQVRVSLGSASRFREALLSAYALSTDDERRGALLLLEDLSGLRALQELVEYSARVTEMGRMTAGVAHEVRNPLNAMRLNLDLLGERIQDDAEAKRALGVLDRAIRSLDRIVEGLLDYLRPVPLDKSEVEVDDLLRGLGGFFEADAVQRNVRLELELATGKERIEADANRLHQVFVNLIQNAFDAMPDGGVLRMRTALEPGWLRVRIEDTGKGIAPQDRERIFHLYYSTRPEGSGIGLSIVQRIVLEHGGTLTVDSEPGQGACFEVRLPRCRPDASPEERSPGTTR
jgi:PAS domain S-box-containing protein